MLVSMQRFAKATIQRGVCVCVCVAIGLIWEYHDGQKIIVLKDKEEKNGSVSLFSKVST